MSKKGESIDIGIDGVTIEKSPDGQHRVLIRIPYRMLEGDINSTTYRRGKVANPDNCRPGSKRGAMIGKTLSDHDGVRLVILKNVRGAYINIDLDHPKLKHLLRVVAREMLKFGEEFELMLARRAKLMQILSEDKPHP